MANQQKDNTISPAKINILALDVGGKYIGCAWVQEHGIAINPLPAITRKNGSLALGPLKKCIKQYNISDIVIGIPLKDGKRCKQSNKSRAYRGKLRKHFPNLQITLQDETLSTWITKKKFAHLKLGKSQGTRNIDSFAAMEILSDYLNGFPSSVESKVSKNTTVSSDIPLQNISNE